MVGLRLTARTTVQFACSNVVNLRRYAIKASYSTAKDSSLVSKAQNEKLKAGFLVGFRRYIITSPADWPFIRMRNEIERVWRGMQNSGGGISDADNSIMKPSSLAVTAAEGILERQAVRRGALSPTTEPKVMQRLTRYVDTWGGRNVLEIFTKALMLLPPPLLEFYCGDHDTADTRGLSLPQFSELLGASSPSASINEVARNTSHCVYVRVFPGGQITSNCRASHRHI